MKKKKIKKVVIKVGSSLIANYKTGLPKLNWINLFINDLNFLIKKKIKIIIVSSGAIAIGRKRIGFLKKKLNLDEQQAAASVGQIYLINNYKKAFNKKKVEISQVLLTLEDSIKKEKKSKKIYLREILINYSNSKDFGLPYTYTEKTYNQFLLTTIKNVNLNGENVGFLAISENANEIRTAINERKSFIIRTAFLVVIAILIFSLVLNRYFLKPIKNLVSYTKIIKEKSRKKSNIEMLKKRNDEIGVLSKSLDDMTNDLYKRINVAENFSTDLVHEIRNPLASLKSASEIIGDTEDQSKREKLVKILTHDVERIERLITDYSQMLKDEVALSKEQMNKIDLRSVVESVVDDFNSIYEEKRGIIVDLSFDKSISNFNILGIENRIEQIMANLLDNAISFSEDNKKVKVEILKDQSGKVILRIVDQGQGFKEKKLNKIFDRFYSNRPDKFGEHSGLGLNIVKNLVELHGGIIAASNNPDKIGARIEIYFPKV